MDGSKHIHLGERYDECDVCAVPITDVSQAFSTEYGGKVLTFCSELCFKRYLEDPAVYAEFEDDERLE
jgi:YHS domain-containing protein